MKFGFIVTNITGGGAEKAVLNTCSGLAQRGHDVHLVLLENIVMHDVPAEIPVHALTSPGRRLSKGLPGKWYAAWRLHALLARLAKDQAFDLIVSTLPFADEVAIRARLPRHRCRIANTLSAEIARLRARSPAKAARREARYRSLYGKHPLIAVSDGVAEDLHSQLGVPRASIERIFNPFDFSAMRAAARQPAALPGVPYVIHVGRFTPQKRHDLLLDAWARLDVRHKLVLLTAPDAALSAMIEARGLTERVMVAGFQQNPFPWMAHADLLVLSSDHEGLCNVIIEALAVGTPVVSTDCPSSPREILGASCPDCLVPVGDAAALAQAIRRALNDPPDPAQVDLGPYGFDASISAYERLAAQHAGHAIHGNSFEKGKA